MVTESGSHSAKHHPMQLKERKNENVVLPYDHGQFVMPFQRKIIKTKHEKNIKIVCRKIYNKYFDSHIHGWSVICKCLRMRKKKNEHLIWFKNKPCLSFSFRIFSMSPALFLTRPKKSYVGRKNKIWILYLNYSRKFGNLELTMNLCLHLFHWI